MTTHCHFQWQVVHCSNNVFLGLVGYVVTAIVQVQAHTTPGFFIPGTFPGNTGEWSFRKIEFFSKFLEFLKKYLEFLGKIDFSITFLEFEQKILLFLQVSLNFWTFLKVGSQIKLLLLHKKLFCELIQSSKVSQKLSFRIKFLSLWKKLLEFRFRWVFSPWVFGKSANKKAWDIQK